MRILRSPSLVVANLALLASACVSPTEALPGVVVETDATSYVAEALPGTPPRTQYAFRVIVRTTNGSQEPVRLARCNPESAGPIFGVELYAVTAGTRSAFNPAWGCLGGVAPIEIRPGAARVDTLIIHGPTVFNGVTGEPVGIAEGTMVLRLASESRRLVSNRFSVSLAPRAEIGAPAPLPMSTDRTSFHLWSTSLRSLTR